MNKKGVIANCLYEYIYSEPDWYSEIAGVVPALTEVDVTDDQSYENFVKVLATEVIDGYSGKPDLIEGFVDRKFVAISRQEGTT